MKAGGWRELWLDEIDSTQAYLHRHPQPPGTVVVARHQTAGRGRRGQPWESGAGKNLTFSAVLSVMGEWRDRSLIGLAAGLAVAELIEALGYAPCLKWPNDVLIGCRKVAGILVEVSGGRALVGIGLNLNQREFAAGLGATSLALEDGRHWSPAEVLEWLMPRLLARTGELDRDDILTGVRCRCCLRGRRVSLCCSGQRWTGVVEGIGPDGALRVEVDGGVRCFAQADEVRLVQDD